MPVLLVLAGTLVFCLVAGAVLARTTQMDAPTAALGMMAGGASGIVGMSGDLGGDDRLVAFMQYARVFVVVLTPVGLALVPPRRGTGSARSAARSGTSGGVAGR